MTAICVNCVHYDPLRPEHPNYVPPPSCYCAVKDAITDANRKACLKGRQR